jgi:hypothetical protein
MLREDYPIWGLLKRGQLRKACARESSKRAQQNIEQLSFHGRRSLRNIYIHPRPSEMLLKGFAVGEV